MNRIIWFLVLIFIVWILANPTTKEMKEFKQNNLSNFSKENLEKQKNNIIEDLKLKFNYGITKLNVTLDQNTNQESDIITQTPIKAYSFNLNKYIQEIEQDLQNPNKAKCGDICEIEYTEYEDKEFKKIKRNSKERVILGNNNFIMELDETLFNSSVGETKLLKLEEYNYFAKIKLLNIENSRSDKFKLEFSSSYINLGKIQCSNLIQLNFKILSNKNDIIYDHRSINNKNYITRVSSWDTPLFIIYGLSALHIGNKLTIIGDKELMKSRTGNIPESLKEIYNELEGEIRYELDNISYYHF